MNANGSSTLSHEPSQNKTTTTYRVCIVGAGFSGLGMAIRLKQQGHDDYVVIERSSSLGGTWRDNSYPGAGCDIMSLLYSYSFAPNTEWSTTFASQEEILAYLNKCADEFSVRPMIQFGQELLSASWDEESQNWLVHTTDLTFRAKILVGATGYLSDADVPDLPGVKGFTGELMHTSSWDHGVDLTGKTVAVVGTGASAIQLIPAIQPIVGDLAVYQRTPAWVAPRSNEQVSPLTRFARRHLPGFQKFGRESNKWGREILAVMMARPKVMEKTLQGAAMKNLEEQVADPRLRAILTPDYTIGCKRILFSSEYYPALAAANTEVVPHGVAALTPTGVIAADGVERQADVVVFATGFRAIRRPAAAKIHGRGGVRLDQAWSDEMSAYVGTTVHGFPNLFLMLGPNTALGHSSQTVMIEAQIDYVLDAMKVMVEQSITSFDVRSDVQARYGDWLEGRFEGSVWQAGGCTSWYQDEKGHNASVWPTFTFTFERLTRSFKTSDYALRAEDVSSHQFNKPSHQLEPL